jgi:hypothetical protein
MSKQDALTYAKQLEVDRFVRKLAYTGRTDGYNFCYDWHDDATELEVRATKDANTNSAYVQMMNGTLLYQAHDYGRQITVYRHGQWIHRLRELADSEYEAAEERRKIEVERRAIVEAANFAPIDF